MGERSPCQEVRMTRRRISLRSPRNPQWNQTVMWSVLVFAAILAVALWAMSDLHVNWFGY